MALFNVSIKDDRLLEIDEKFMLRIDPAQLIPQVFLGDISQATALIVDDDRKCNM